MRRMDTGKLAAFTALWNRKILICVPFVQFFLITSLHLFPSWIGIFLPKLIAKFNWEQSPFKLAELEVHSQIDCIAEELNQLQSQQMWRDKFKTVSLTQFLANVQSMEPNLSDLCQQGAVALLPFPTTFYCETSFSIYQALPQTATERGYQIALMTIIPDFDKLVKQAPGQSSH